MIIQVLMLIQVLMIKQVLMMMMMISWSVGVAETWVVLQAVPRCRVTGEVYVDWEAGGVRAHYPTELSTQLV